MAGISHPYLHYIIDVIATVRRPGIPLRYIADDPSAEWCNQLRHSGEGSAMEDQAECDTTAVKRTSIDDTEKETTQSKSKAKKNKRPVKRAVRHGRKQPAVSFNFAPAIDFGAMDVAGAMGNTDEPDNLDSTSSEPSAIVVPTWCPGCGFNCNDPDTHNKNYKEHERSIVRATDKKNVWLLAELLAEKKTVDGEGSSEKETQWKRDLQFALLVSLHKRCEATMKMLLEAGAEATDIVLHTATMIGNLTLLRLLHKAGTDLDVPNAAQGRTPLHFASEWGHSDIVRYLMEIGADPNRKDCTGETPLHMAAKHGKMESIESLIEAGVDTNAADSKGQMPWMYASLNNSAEALTRLLPEDIIPSGLEEALYRACQAGSEKSVQVLIEKGANPGQIFVNHCGFTPLLVAMENKAYTLMRYLLVNHSRKLRINHANAEGECALKYALDHTHFAASQAILGLLTKTGIDVNLERPGKEPLIFEHLKRIESLRWLIEAGADLSMRSPKGETILHAVLDSGSKRIQDNLDTLFKANIDPALSSYEYEGKTPLIKALSQGCEPGVLTLLGNGCSLKGVSSWLKDGDHSNMEHERAWPAIKTYLKLASSNAPSLQEACRFAILQQLNYAKNSTASLHKLPLPRMIQDYLTPRGFSNYKAILTVC